LFSLVGIFNSFLLVACFTKAFARRTTHYSL